MAMTAAAAENKPVVFTKDGIEEAALPWRFVDSPIKPVDTRRMRWHFGYVEVKTPLGPLRVFYLPLMPPMHYSPGSPDWNEIPNAFIMTGTQIPQRPQADAQTDIEIPPPPH